MGPHGPDHRLALADRQRHGLFAVDVLAGLRGGDRDQGVPMIGNDDRHGVNVGTRQHVAEVVVRLAAGVSSRGRLRGIIRLDLFLGRLPPQELLGRAVAVAGRVHVADGDDLHVVLLEEGGKIESALIAVADDRHVDAVAGRGGEDRRRQNPGRADRQGRGLDEITAAGRSPQTGLRRVEHACLQNGHGKGPCAAVAR